MQMLQLLRSLAVNFGEGCIAPELLSWDFNPTNQCDCCVLATLNLPRIPFLERKPNESL